MTALGVLRLLLRSYDPKQFASPELAYAWFCARQLVDDDDRRHPNGAHR